MRRSVDHVELFTSFFIVYCVVTKGVFYLTYCSSFVRHAM